MRKIEYSKGCYCESLIVTQNGQTTLHVVSGMTSSANDVTCSGELKTLALELLNLSNEQQLQTFYHYNLEPYFEDESLIPPVPSSEAIKAQGIDYIHNLAADRVFQAVADLMDLFPQRERDSYVCDGCGDSNYSFVVTV